MTSGATAPSDSAGEKKKVSCGKTVFEKVLGVLDSYGAIMGSHPGMKKKSLMGAIIALLFKAIFLLLIIWSLIKLFTTDPIASQGLNVSYNWKNVNKLKGGPKTVDYPAMFLRLNSSITFFEKNAPTIQKVQVVDRTGYGPNFVSKEERVPNIQALYAAQSVPLNSFDTHISDVESGVSRTVDVAQTISEQSAHRFDETLKAAYSLGSGLGNQEFANHTVSAYIRLTKGQLKYIKSCQLQIALVNSEEYEILVEEGGQMKDKLDKFTTILTSPSTWDSSNFDENTGLYKLFLTADKAYNLINLKAHYTEADKDAFLAKVGTTIKTVEPSNFANWKLMINYVPNFRSVLDETKCANKAVFRKAIAVANAMDSSATSITNITNSQNADWCDPAITLPFVITVSNHAGMERMLVTHIAPDCKSMTVDRSIDTPLDFTVVFDQPTPGVSEIPDSWFCDPKSYGQRDGCQCNCGAPDPDCLQTKGKSAACATDEICSTRTGLCVPKEIQESAYSNSFSVAISESCDWVYGKQEEINVGFVGNLTQMLAKCSTCPGDTLNNNEAKLDGNGEMVCNYPAKGTVDAVSLPTISIDANGAILVNVSAIGEPFPTVNEEYYVSIGDQDVAVVDVVGATPAVNYQQQLKLQDRSGALTFADAITYFSRGSVISSVQSGDTTLLVKVDSMTDPSDGTTVIQRSFPTSPFTINVNDVYYGSSGATEPGQYLTDGNFYQVITLASPISSLAKGSRAFIAEAASTGSNEITVRFTPKTVPQFFNLTGGNTYSFLIDNGAYSFEEIQVTAVTPLHNYTCDVSTFNALDGICNCNCGQFDPDCATSGSFTLQGCSGGFTYCSLSSTCTNTAPAYQSVVYETSLKYKLALMYPLNEDHNAGETVNAYDQTNLPVGRVTPVIVNREYSTFLPSKRGQPTPYEPFTSPETLDVESAIFIIPEVEKFEAVNLCPNVEISNPFKPISPYQKWELDKKLSVSCESIANIYKSTCPSVSSVDFDANSYFDTCIAEVPPTYQFNYYIDVPVSGYWNDDSFDVEANPQMQNIIFNVNSPEVNFDFEVIYTFSYDTETVEAERLFAEKILKGGDRTSELNKRIFFGALDYVGPSQFGSNAMPSLKNALPASLPYLKTNLNLKADIDRTEAILQKFTSIAYWPKDRESLEELIQKFEDFEIEWDLSSITESGSATVVPAEPGYLYTLQAQVQIIPVFADNYPWSLLSALINVIPEFYLSHWYITVPSQSISKQPLSYLNRNQLRFRYIIAFNPKINEVNEKRMFNIRTFITDLGSAISIMGLGLTVLKFVQMISFFNPAYAGFLGGSNNQDNKDEKSPAKEVQVQRKTEPLDNELKETSLDGNNTK